MSKHAPGPWLPEDPDFPGAPVVIDSRHHLIAEVDHSTRDDETTTANARPIAAAPDLKAACEAILADADEGGPADFGLFCIRPNLIDALRTALTRVEA